MLQCLSGRCIKLPPSAHPCLIARGDIDTIEQLAVTAALSASCLSINQSFLSHSLPLSYSHNHHPKLPRNRPFSAPRSFIPSSDTSNLLGNCLKVFTHCVSDSPLILIAVALTLAPPATSCLAWSQSPMPCMGISITLPSTSSPPCPEPC